MFELAFKNFVVNCFLTESPTVFEEEDELPEDPSDIQENLAQKFLVEMPKDFYDFWDFCMNKNANNPFGKPFTQHYH